MKKLGIFKWALILSIVIVLNLFFYYAASLVYTEPKHKDFCPEKQVNILPIDQSTCVANGGSWNENPTLKTITAESGVVVTEKKEVSGYCDPNFTCQKEFQTALDLYNRNIFLILVVLGVLSLVVGYLVAFNSVVSLGLSFGGVLSFIIASIRYWSAMQEYLRVIILALALAILIILAIKRFKD